MSEKIPIRDFYGKIIGYRREKLNGDIEISDFYGRIKGRYDKRLDVTRDFYGRIISRGDTSAALLNL